MELTCYLKQEAEKDVLINVKGFSLQSKYILHRDSAKMDRLLQFLITWVSSWPPPPLENFLKGWGILSKEKGVVLYAVNSGETKAEIREFLDKTKLPITVARDEDQDISQTYQIAGLPMNIPWT